MVFEAYGISRIIADPLQRAQAFAMHGGEPAEEGERQPAVPALDTALAAARLATDAPKQSYNAQAAVDADLMLIVGAHLTNTPVDARQLVPMLNELAKLPEALGRIAQVLADAGCFSQANVEQALQRRVEPLIARRQDQHYVPWLDRITEPPPLDTSASPGDRMAHRLRTPEGRALRGLRKQTVEPVFGIIKSVMHFRQFLLRGLRKGDGEWSLRAIAWNIRRMAVLEG